MSDNSNITDEAVKVLNNSIKENINKLSKFITKISNLRVITDNILDLIMKDIDVE